MFESIVKSFEELVELIKKKDKPTIQVDMEGMADFVRLGMTGKRYHFNMN